MLLNQRRELREAIYLWYLMNSSAVVSPPQWWPVSRGEGLSDEYLASLLDITASTARQWRLRLEHAGLVRSEKVSRHKRRFEVLNLNFAERDTPLVSKATEVRPN
jgi:hypothetical protein